MDQFFTTTDHAKLHYIEEGSGDRAIILIHGWGCAAAHYRYQIDVLKSEFHVYAIDLRGHGDSPTPGYGFRISRLAKDIEEFIAHIGAQKVTLCGHSMGCSVIWSYVELFGQERLDKLVLIDEDPVIIDFPSWTAEEKANYGGLFTSAATFETTAALKGADGDAVAAGLLGGLFTSEVDETLKSWALQHALKASRKDTADLIFNHAMNDWSTVIPRITVPTLVFGGKLSAMDYRSMQWIGNVIPNAETCILGEDEHSSHFMFLENPQKFNRVLIDFLRK